MTIIDYKKSTIPIKVEISKIDKFLSKYYTNIPTKREFNTMTRFKGM